MAMPIFQTIAFSGTFFAITKIPGFPTDRSVNWYLPLACCMGSGFAGVGLGFSTVRDIESGFFDRLRMAPAPRPALIIGPLFTAWIRVLIVITTVVIVGLLFGARLTGGVARTGDDVHRRARRGDDRRSDGGSAWPIASATCVPRR